jgi:hypothetical protein
MYLNFNLIQKNNLLPIDVVVLQFLKQLRSEPMDYSLYDIHIFHLEKLGYVDRLKDRSPRLSKKGKELLKLIQTPGATQNYVALAEYLIEKYKSEDLIICSKSKLIDLIVWFCSETSLTARELYELIVEYFTTEDSKYNKRLDFLFFKPDKLYQENNLSCSRLYAYLESKNN